LYFKNTAQQRKISTAKKLQKDRKISEGKERKLSISMIGQKLMSKRRKTSEKTSVLENQNAIY